MTNPKKTAERLIQRAKNAVMNAVPDVEEARELLCDYLCDHSDARQESEKDQLLKAAIDALDEIIVAMESAFDTEPDLSDL